MACAVETVSKQTTNNVIIKRLQMVTYLLELKIGALRKATSKLWSTVSTKQKPSC